MTSLAVVASAVTAAATVALVAAEARGAARGRAIAKPIAALGFVAVGLSGGPPADRYGALIALGLVLGAAGDVALLGGGRWFALGIACFLVGHLAYLGAALSLGGSIGPLSAAIATGLALATYAWLRGHLDGKVAPRPLVGLYLAVGFAMALAATAPVLDGLGGARPELLAVGAALFLLSDLAVARQRFVAASFANKATGLPLYFAAQLLLAWSAISAS